MLIAEISAGIIVALALMAFWRVLIPLMAVLPMIVAMAAAVI